MMLWKIALFLFIFGAAVSAVNDLAIYNATVPGSNIQPVTEAEITDISQEAMSTGLNPLFTFFIVQTFGKALVSGFLAILSILPLFCSLLGGFGIPLVYSIPIGMVIQLPVWYVMLNGLYQLWTGYNEEGMS